MTQDYDLEVIWAQLEAALSAKAADRKSAVTDRAELIIQVAYSAISKSVSDLEARGFYDTEKELRQYVSIIMMLSSEEDLRRSEVLSSSLCFAEPELVAFVAGAVASGVIGNLAYDSLKALIRKSIDAAKKVSLALRQDGQIAPREFTEVVLDDLVKRAVIDQCEHHGLDIPRYDELKVIGWTYSPEIALATVGTISGDLRARVSMPAHDIQSQGMNVQIHQRAWEKRIRRDAEIEWRRKYNSLRAEIDNRLSKEALLRILRNAETPGHAAIELKRTIDELSEHKLGWDLHFYLFAKRSASVREILEDGSVDRTEIVEFMQMITYMDAGK